MTKRLILGLCAGLLIASAVSATPASNPMADVDLMAPVALDLSSFPADATVLVGTFEAAVPVALHCANGADVVAMVEFAELYRADTAPPLDDANTTATTARTGATASHAPEVSGWPC